LLTLNTFGSSETACRISPLISKRLAVLFIDGVNMNQKMIDEGIAEPNDR